MFKNKSSLVDVISPYLKGISSDNNIYGHIIKLSTSDYNCSSTIKNIDYFKLCIMSKKNNYKITIIQDGKIFNTDTDNYFNGSFEPISACYRIDPFKEAMVIAQKTSKKNSIKVFHYRSYAIKKEIIVPYISCFKHLFKYFNVYKTDGSLAENLNKISEEKEVIAISKKSIYFRNDFGENVNLYYILKWYK